MENDHWASMESRVARLDERVKANADILEKFLTREMERVRGEIQRLQKDSNELYVTRAEFRAQVEPVLRVFYLALALLTTAVVGSVLALIFGLVKVGV